MPTPNHLFLNSVRRPSRYVAGEYNLKPIDTSAPVRWCFAFPDVYEIGMSFTGMNILYGLLNGSELSSCERVFTPWIDAEERLRELRMRLTSLETDTPIADFDVLGFSLQHEMNYTNVLTILDLAGIPLWQMDRDREHPIVIGGGSCVYNAEPMAEFFDAFVIGDGEDVILEINRLLADTPVHRSDRGTLLRALAGVPGVYVPSLYDVRYREDGTVAGFDRKYDDLPLPVEARKVQLNGAYIDTSPMVASMETVHDRAAIEVLRGCTRGCRFCQAGYITRPIRERPSEELVRLSRELMKNTGYDNLSLLSLSTADHKNLPGIVDGLLEDWDPSVGISLPSLRIDGFDMRVATRLAELHQTGFTFAPEAGSRRLRKVISKDVGDREIFSTLEGVFQKGWQTIKLYFQMGLPTETYEDLDELVDLVVRVRNLLIKKVPKRPKLNVSVNPHVPKPFTPFMWWGQDDVETLREKARYLKRKLPRGPVHFSYHEPELSVLEGVMARGDRRVAKAIHRAWELGCRFDDWNETFRFDLWMRAFEETGVDPKFYNQRNRGEHEIFPWETVSCGVARDFLWLEWTRAVKEKATYDCRDRRTCTICEICDEDYRHDLYPPEDGPQLGPSLVKIATLQDGEVGNDLCSASAQTEVPRPATVKRYEGPRKTLRLEFSKTGVSRWLSHLDLQKSLLQTFRRAELPLAPSEGFNPRPKISFAMALPVGAECHSEWVDVVLKAQPPASEWTEEFMVARLNAVSPPGIGFQSCQWLEASDENLAKSAHFIDLEIRWLPETPHLPETVDRIAEGIAAFNAGEPLSVERPAREGKKAKRIRLSDCVEGIELAMEGDRPVLMATLSVDNGQAARAEELVAALAGPLEMEARFLDITRRRVRLEGCRFAEVSSG
jgi:radical SAM family uncharacterized protein/radical SAM-linked protein